MGKGEERPSPDLCNKALFYNTSIPQILGLGENIIESPYLYLKLAFSK